MSAPALFTFATTFIGALIFSGLAIAAAWERPNLKNVPWIGLALMVFATLAPFLSATWIDAP